MSIRSRVPPFKKRAIEKVELLGLPNYLFEVEVSFRDHSQKVNVAVESVGGLVTVLQEGTEFEDRDDVEELPSVLSVEEARERIHSDYRWLLLAAGLKQRRKYKIEAVADRGEFLFPYWAGYFRRRGRWEFDLVDAVSGALQGPTTRRVVLDAICMKDGK